MQIEELLKNPKTAKIIVDRMMRSSCAFFAQTLLSGAPEPPYNGKFYISEHHEEWDELLLNHERLCVLAARDSGKTFFFDFAYPLWKANYMPNTSGYIFSATQEQASRILGDIKEEVESNPNLAHLLPKPKTMWTKTAIRLANGHEIYARGFGVKVRGAHPIWCVIDDGLNDEDAYSPTTRSRNIDYFNSAIANLVIPGGQIIVVGTPFALNDLYSYLKKNEVYHYAEYPAESNPGSDDNKALWPERYSLSRLQVKRKEIGTVAYTREFLLKPMSDDMSLFPMPLFQGDPVEQFNIVLGMEKEYWDAAGVQIYMGVDFAISSSASADYTVIWLMGKDSLGNRWIIDIFTGKGLPYQTQKNKIMEYAVKYDPTLVLLESNQMQSIFGNELIRNTDLPIKKYQTGVEKHSLEKGVPSLRILLENGKFRIPRGDSRSIEITDKWIEQMNSFTYDDGKLVSVADHDDLAMASWLCNLAIKMGGFTVSFGEEETPMKTPSAGNKEEASLVSDGDLLSLPPISSSYY